MGHQVIAAVMMVKDEQDIIRSTVSHLLEQVDLVLVADNGSTDSTGEILADMAARSDGRLTVVEDPDPAYRQSEKMSSLAVKAHDMGAVWVVATDADEWWCCNDGQRVGDMLAGLPAGVTVLAAPIFDYMTTGLDNPAVADPVTRMGWRRVDPLPLVKVACRAMPGLVVEQGNHGARYDGVTVAPSVSTLVVRHYPYRGVEQFVRKVVNGSAAYRAAGDTLPADAGAHWRQWGDMLDAQGVASVEGIYWTWYHRQDPTATQVMGDGTVLQPLIFDPAPDNRPKRETPDGI